MCFLIVESYYFQYVYPPACDPSRRGLAVFRSRLLGGVAYSTETHDLSSRSSNTRCHDLDLAVVLFRRMGALSLVVPFCCLFPASLLCQAVFLRELLVRHTGSNLTRGCFLFQFCLLCSSDICNCGPRAQVGLQLKGCRNSSIQGPLSHAKSDLRVVQLSQESIQG